MSLVLLARMHKVISLYCRRSYSSASNVFCEGDRVLLHVKDASKAPMFTKPLRRKRKAISHWGSIDHEAIIGKQARDVVVTSTGRKLRIGKPTLDEYVTLTPRLVTPVYPADANFIVSLLDLHVSQPQPSSQKEPPLEILEAGTGQGALTLHLARAIHAANAPPPVDSIPASARDQHAVVTSVDAAEEQQSQERDLALKTWKSQRRAVIHTIDISPEYSQHARKIVHGFKQGLYSGNIDFHVGDVSQWISERQHPTHQEAQAHPEPFLSHILLDLPESHRHIKTASSALKVDGLLIVFNPSITQINACVKVIRALKLPLILDRVVELGPSITGGREWDVREVRPRALIKAENERNGALAASTESATSASLTGSGDEESVGRAMELKSRDEGQLTASKDGEIQEESGWKMICRPKVGLMVTVGGFLGVWRKMQQREGWES